VVPALGNIRVCVGGIDPATRYGQSSSTPQEVPRGADIIHIRRSGIQIKIQPLYRRAKADGAQIFPVIADRNGGDVSEFPFLAFAGVPMSPSHGGETLDQLLRNLGPPFSESTGIFRRTVRRVVGVPLEVDYQGTVIKTFDAGGDAGSIKERPEERHENKSPEGESGSSGPHG
jgi:hypothetical protein